MSIDRKSSSHEETRLLNASLLRETNSATSHDLLPLVMHSHAPERMDPDYRSLIPSYRCHERGAMAKDTHATTFPPIFCVREEEAERNPALCRR